MLLLAAAWLLYGIGTELFIAWYSGSESDIGLREWITAAVQVAVNTAAAVLGWRIVRVPPSRRTEI